jgi:hypothetical protein
MYQNTFNKVVFKRLTKEMELYNLSNYKYTINIFLTDINDNKEDDILISVEKDNNKILELIVPKTYPFKPYNYFSSSIIDKNNNRQLNYYKYIQNIHNYLNKNNIDKKILNFFYSIYHKRSSNFLKLDKNECYCCNSIFCYNNWSPSKNIKDVINEIEEIEFIESYKNGLEKIYNNIFMSKLPDDIILKILNNIIL